LLIVLTVALGVGPILTQAQQGQSEELVRRAKSKVQPNYPELARKMNIAGTVKIEVVVAPNGTVKEARLVGGHPVLASAVLEAVKKWRYEARPQETIENLQFRFDPTQ
jgi:TonB family protein